MKRHCAVLLLSLATCSIAACDGIDQAVNAVTGEQSKSKVDMAGVWTYHDGILTSIYTLRADGTCTKSYLLPPSFPKQSDANGKWSLGDDMRLYVNLDYNEIFIVHASEKSLTFENVQFKEIYTRK